MDAALGNIVTAAEKAHPLREGDYIGDDGLLYCGKCHTVKQKRVNLPGWPEGYAFPADCRCEAAEHKEDRRRQQLETLVLDLRETAFDEPEMLRWTFDNDLGYQPALTEGMRRYVEMLTTNPLEECPGLLLTGDVGRGKSFAAAQVVNALIEKGIRCRMTSFGRIEDDLKDRQVNVREYRERLNHCKLLVLDDLGTERSTTYMDEFVYKIIDARYRSRLPLILTTNLPLEEIKKPKSTADSRVFSRILQMCHPVNVEGHDIRRRIAADRYTDMRDLLGI